MTLVMIEATPSTDETRVARRKRQTRDRIFHAALDLFVEKGLEDTTVAEIARVADIGKGTFFTYYPTKECVFADVNRDIVADMEKAIDRAVAARKPLEPRLHAFFMPGVRWHLANPVLSRHMLGAFVRDREFMRLDRGNLDRLQSRLGRELECARKSGDISPDIALPDAATAITGAYFGSLGVWHVTEMKSRLATDFARSLHIVLRGLRP
jgi:AcrR family transcriptional regulator